MIAQLQMVILIKNYFFTVVKIIFRFEFFLIVVSLV
jgi:hypothetical protein